MRATGRTNRGLAVEAAAFGLGYTCVLCAKHGLVAIFGGASLARPYWPVLPWLRTEPHRVITFALAAVSLVVSKYLRLRRSAAGAIAQNPVNRPAWVQAVQAVAETAAVLATALVAYLAERRDAQCDPRPAADPSVAVAERGYRPGDRSRDLHVVTATRYLRSAASSSASDQLPVSDHVGTAA